jgi:hypothetical protein
LRKITAADNSGWWWWNTRLSHAKRIESGRRSPTAELNGASYYQGKEMKPLHGLIQK